MIGLDFQLERYGAKPNEPLEGVFFHHQAFAAILYGIVKPLFPAGYRNILRQIPFDLQSGTILDTALRIVGATSAETTFSDRSVNLNQSRNERATNHRYTPFPDLFTTIYCVKTIF